jgi:hypothetical protein
MKCALAVAAVVLTLMSVMLAQESQPVTVKGHVLGESVSQFAKTVGYDLGACPQILKLTPKEAKKQKVLSAFNYSYPVCAGFADAQNGRPLVVLMEVDDNLKLRLQVRSGTTVGGDFPALAGVIENQKLVEFWVRPNPATYNFDDIAAELTGKYGQPATSKTDTVQDDFGAAVKLRSGRWPLPDGTMVTAAETMLRTDFLKYTKTVAVGYFTKERWLANQKKPSALD